MDELRFNKIAAGFLLAALLAMGGYKLSEAVSYTHLTLPTIYSV